MQYEKYSKLELITPKMLYNTVLCDERTCLWFRKLISMPLINERLNGSSEGRKIRSRYQARSMVAVTLAVLSLGLFLAWLMFFQDFYIALSIAAAIAAAGCVFFLLQARRELAAFSAYLITIDRELIPPGTTLFQLGEIYSRKYKVPSLVTVIWIWDQWLRNAFLLIFTITLGVLFLPFFGMALGITAGCCITACLVKIRVMARRS